MTQRDQAEAAGDAPGPVTGSILLDGLIDIPAHLIDIPAHLSELHKQTA